MRKVCSLCYRWLALHLLSFFPFHQPLQVQDGRRQQELHLQLDPSSEQGSAEQMKGLGFSKNTFNDSLSLTQQRFPMGRFNQVLGSLEMVVDESAEESPLGLTCCATLTKWTAYASFSIRSINLAMQGILICFET